MTRWLRALAPSLAAFVASMALPGAAAAAEIRVMISGAFSAAYDQLAPEYERRTGDRIVTVHGPSMGATPQAIPNRLARGEVADVVIMAEEGLVPLIANGVVAAGSRVDLVRSPIGVTVRAGAPRPDISTVEALKRTLLSAKSIAYSDSASGRYIANEMFAKLGLENEMKGKARAIPATPVAQIVAEGQADLGFQQVSEILPIKGAVFVGLLPDAVQKITIFSAAIPARAPQPERAKALIAYLSSPEVAPTVRPAGLDPIAH